MIDGKRYSHIIDTRTGHASEGLSSVTIIAKEATLADALATAVSVLGAQKGLELIERQKEVEGVLITSGPKYEVLKSSGVGKYIE
jgi:thiamine biosynthesis lipoprotein